MSEQSKKPPLGTYFRQKREEKGLLIRQVAAVTELDQAIISRIENNDRLPTKEQLFKLSGLYNLDLKETYSAWLAEKMVRDYGDEPFATDAMQEARDRVSSSMPPQHDQMSVLFRLAEPETNYNKKPDFSRFKSKPNKPGEENKNDSPT